ncbi:hypothetical protein FB379_13910 [Aeribacillus composti]|nr:hypothetical protein FB379_13910 [Aeribacillus composti]
MMVAIATETALIQVIAMIDKPPTVIPPMPAPVANPSCTKELFRLSTIPEASGASEIRLKFWVGPNVQQASSQIMSNRIPSGAN